MSKKILSMAAAICIAGCFSFSIPAYVSASNGEEYITISVDAVDDNGVLKYALDSDDPAAFGDSNEFVVPAGTSHTIYVKDAAGNITSQVYGSETQDGTQYHPVDEEDGQRIDIDLEIGGSGSNMANGSGFSNTAEEPGSATVTSKTITDGSDSAEKVFYTFTTKEGEVLYLIIDQGQSSNNVYLLDTVSIGDLQVLAGGQLSSNNTDSGKEEDNLLSALVSTNEQEKESVPDQSVSTVASSRKNAFMIIILTVIGGGAYYYLKIYRNKKDESMDAMDAMDLDEFEPEEEEEEIGFDFDDSEKEEYLEQLINEDEEFYDADPEAYATSHMSEDEDVEDIDAILDMNDFSEDMDDDTADDEVDLE